MDGNVGEIGGIKYKLIGAYKSGANVFICPSDNYDEAIKIKEDKNYNINVIGVSTFDEAIIKLRSI